MNANANHGGPGGTSIVRWVHSFRAAWRFVALAACLSALPLAASAAEQQTFATPEAAVAALSAALKANDERALIAIVGEKHKALITTGDAAADAARRAEAYALLSRFMVLDDRGPERRVLLIGEQAWPLPIPLVRERGTWRFASEQGIEEMLNRRVGANERQAVGVLRAYVDAQREYASRDRNGDGVLEYASKLNSSPGKQDGLYWPADESKGEQASPFGPLIGRSAPYLAGHKAGDAYRGYHFRIVNRQGKAAAGGEVEVGELTMTESLRRAPGTPRCSSCRSCPRCGRRSCGRTRGAAGSCARPPSGRPEAQPPGGTGCRDPGEGFREPSPAGAAGSRSRRGRGRPPRAAPARRGGKPETSG